MVLLDRSGLRTVTGRGLFGFGRNMVALYRISIVGDTAIEFHRLRDRILDINTAGDRENNVGRAIEFLHVPDDVVTGESAKTFGRADAPSLHPMLLESRGVKFFRS